MVKSFALQMDERDLASRRWIETRLLTKQEGEWAGYSYIWNEDQTDAELVGVKGLDKTFARPRSNPAGQPQVYLQTWHYPSRAECMACHSRAANYVLGLTEVQMNKTHDYGAVSDNQLRVLEHLGLFKLNHLEDTRNVLREEAKAKGMSDKEAGDYVDRLCTEFTELHGDRRYGDDPALIGGPARWQGVPVMLLLQQKGRDTKSKIKRRFGSANPEGYRKAVRLMDLADKFGLPVVALVDTQGAYPGLEAEERGQGYAAHPMKKLQRSAELVLGVVRKEGERFWLTPVEKKERRELAISDLKDAEPGDRDLVDRMLIPVEEHQWLAIGFRNLL